MFGLIKFSLSFTFSVLILSIPYNSKPLFYEIYKVSNPITISIYNKVISTYQGFAKDIDSDLGQNQEQRQDEISSSLSAGLKNNFRSPNDLHRRKQFFQKKMKDDHHHEKFDPHEKKMLEQILESN